jgi:hypothetical protein
MEKVMTDVYNVQVDAPTIALVDAWAKKSTFMPGRRQAVRALIRQALRAHEIKAAKAIVPAAPAPHCAATPAIAPAGGEQQGGAA